MASFTDGSRKSFYPQVSGGVPIDYSGKQWYIFKVVGTNTVDLASSAADQFIGTLNNIERKGQELEIFLRNGAGTHKVILGATVTINAYLTSNASGAAITASTGNQVLGQAMSAGNTGDIIEYMPMTIQKLQ